MNKRALIVRGLIGALVLVCAGFWLTQRTDAIVIINSRPAVDTGMVGLTGSDVFRVHIVNFNDPRANPNPCIVAVQFFDALGQVLSENRIKILGGQAEFADYFDSTLKGASRKHVRARATQFPLPDDGQPVSACVMTAEVFDNRTGQAGIVIVNSHPVP
jgi:hypothetical protein